ncbi:hypothetical protein AG1IA_03053 [Rhizoctonia solani AG-1 IA]|uniref:Uncharacterized protein n=1 Tax=Thanatephorus cucumeris (strain AG1-IA) TaxID=983506 RepID=L8X1D9_THACA|nr:hypothetical protein AG1IA_03053 [Rhizoctonia solani AG-1 IA]
MGISFDGYSSKEGTRPRNRQLIAADQVVSLGMPWSYRPAPFSILHRDTSRRILAPLAYQPLKLGEIRPNGWLHDQLQLQADSLGGHMHDFYPLIKEGSWTGRGNVNYSDLNEVPHAYVLDSPRLKTIVREFLDHVLDTQWDDGWLGPETDDQWQPRWLWGRYPFLLGAIGMAEAEPELADKVCYVRERELKTGRKGQDGRISYSLCSGYMIAEARTKTVNCYTILRYVSRVFRRIGEVHFPRRGSRKRLLLNGESTGMVGAWVLLAVCTSNNPRAYSGVNLAEGLKAMAVGYRFSKDKSGS